MKPAYRASLAALASVPFVMVLSNSLLIPVLPAMQKGMNLSPFQAGLIITAFSLPAGLTIPLGGYLSDRWGRRAVMVPALVLFGLAGLAAGLAPLLLRHPFAAILAARAVQGVGGGGMYQVAMALAGDIFQSTERAKALGILEAANGVGKVVAPILGAAAALWGWFAPYFVYPVLALPSAAAVGLLAREPPKERLQHQPLSRYLAQVRNAWSQGRGRLVYSFFAGLVALFLLFGVLSHYSDVLESRWRVHGFGKGLVLAVPLLGMALATLVAGLALQETGNGRLRLFLAGGFALAAAGLAAAALSADPLWYTLGITGLGAGTGLALPTLNTVVTGLTGAGARGILTALYGTVRFLGAALGPPAAAHLAAAWPAGVLWGGTALAAVTAALALLGPAGRQPAAVTPWRRGASR